MGALLVLRRNLARGLILVALPLALLVYLSLQSRYFGRWLLPAYPALAMLAGVAIVQAADAIAAAIGRRRAGASERSGAERPQRDAAPRRGLLAGVLAAAIAALVLLQPLAADVRTAQILGRIDTREQARDFLVDNYPPGLRVSIEPAVPGRWYRTNPSGLDPASLKRCPRRDDWTEPGWSYPSAGGKRVCERYRPGQFTRPDGGVRASAYQLVLRPSVIDDYRFYGYCLVVTFGTVRERAEQSGGRRARAYYERLERESTVLRRFSPFDPGAKPVPFDFDRSFNYEPAAYERPGPVVTIYKLDDCRQAYGTSLIQLPRAVELPPFAPRVAEAIDEEL